MTDRLTDRESNRQKERERERQRDRETETDIETDRDREIEKDGGSEKLLTTCLATLMLGVYTRRPMTIAAITTRSLPLALPYIKRDAQRSSNPSSVEN